MIFNKLDKIWSKKPQPFYVDKDNELKFDQLKNIEVIGLNRLKKGDVVAIIGDFEPKSIYTLLLLIEKGCIVVPLTKETIKQHEYFLEESKAQYIFHKNLLQSEISQFQKPHKLLDQLRNNGNPGLILFSTGTTGRPKAILHNFSDFLERYKTVRPPLKTLTFLLFDHIGGLNTLFHMLFNGGTVVSLQERSVQKVLEMCERHAIELLPTTPTFLRLLSLHSNPIIYTKSLRIISYGTERMDEITLKKLCKILPNIEFRQTYGMSELGIMRIKSLSNDSTFMKVGGEGVQTKVINNILYIKSKSRMIGYMNSKNPFDSDGWYCTDDIVEKNEEDYIRIIGRNNDVINVGGLKFMPSEIELVCLKHIGVKFAKAYAVPNPFTGQHLELKIELEDKKDFDKVSFENFLKNNLVKHMRPLKIRYEKLTLSHRFKKL